MTEWTCFPCPLILFWQATIEKAYSPKLTSEIFSLRKRCITEEISFPLSGFKFMPKLVFDKAKPNPIYLLVFLKMHKYDMVLIRKRACCRKEIMGLESI